MFRCSVFRLPMFISMLCVQLSVYELPTCLNFTCKFRCSTFVFRTSKQDFRLSQSQSRLITKTHVTCHVPLFILQVLLLWFCCSISNVQDSFPDVFLHVPLLISIPECRRWTGINRRRRPPIGKSVSFRFRVVRASKRARRSCAGV